MLRNPPHILEKSKTLIPQVMSMLVSHLTTESSQNIDAMVDHANNAFFTLDWLEAGCASSYMDVKDSIAYQYDLLTAERDRVMQPFPELTNTMMPKFKANDLERKIFQTQAIVQTAKRKKEHLKRQTAEAMDIIGRLKHEVADIAQVEVQKLRFQMEKSERALHGIEATTRRLQSVLS